MMRWRKASRLIFPEPALFHSGLGLERQGWTFRCRLVAGAMVPSKMFLVHKRHLFTRCNLNIPERSRNATSRMSLPSPGKDRASACLNGSGIRGSFSHRVSLVTVQSDCVTSDQHELDQLLDHLPCIRPPCWKPRPEIFGAFSQVFRVYRIMPAIYRYFSIGPESHSKSSRTS